MAPGRGSRPRIDSPIGTRQRALTRRSIIWTLVALATGVLFLWSLSPPAPLRLDAPGWDDLAARTVPGAYHVHTTRSDGHADRAGVASAAARAGLKFVILTDHGDGTRPPDPPIYVDGVLVLDGVEISTDHGHYAALDMPRAPYPLGGAGEAVVEDVRRLGGLGIVAHPDSPKASLRWTGEVRPDGVEWLNLDSEWRDESRWTLLRAAAAYLVRGGPALGLVLDRPATLDARWASLLAGGRSVALAAADAHGGAGRREEDPGRSVAASIGIPSYEASFRAFSNRVVLDQPLSGEAAADARAVYGAIREGSVFSAVDGLAGPALLDFRVEAGSNRGGMGSVLPANSSATLIARAVAPPGSQISIVHNGGPIASTVGTELRHDVSGATGAYHVEILTPGAPGQPPVPWLVSNAIYFGVPDEAARAYPSVVPAGAASPPALFDGPFTWRIEKDPTSSATLRTAERTASLEYKLGEGPRRSQYVAIAADLAAGISFSRVQFSLAGDRPLRVSVQLRAADGGRWGRSYYVDPAGSVLDVPVASLTAIGSAAASSPVSGATSLLLVIDLTNAQPGRSGTLRVRSSALLP